MAPLVAAVLVAVATLSPGARALRPEHTRDHLEDARLVAVEGRSSMSEQCEPFPGKRVVMVTVSTDYFDMFTNWFGSAKRFLQATEHLHMIAEDEGAVALLQAFLKDKDFDYSVASPKESSSMVQLRPPWHSEGYGGVVWERPSHIVNFLRLGCSVLYVDIDTVWMKDPFHEIERAGDADLYITDDAPGTDRHNLCTCFMYFQPAHAAKSLLQNWAASATGTANQPIFNSVLREAVKANTAPEVRVLDVRQFPPGVLVLARNGTELLEGAPTDPTVYHSNWRVGQVEKVGFFDALGMWNPAPRTM